MESIPEPLKLLVGQLAKLPGLGPKSALRVAMVLLKMPEMATKRLGQDIYELRDKLRLCSRCGALTEADPCTICADASRDPALLCLVAEWDSLVTLEAGNFFKGRYLVLGGLLAPTHNLSVQDLELDLLLARLSEGEIKEVILALGATVEAETTANLVRTLVMRHHPTVKVSRLAQGIPLGAEVKFMDSETLRQSLKYRQDF